jgi:preprotein translocase subunit SecF
MVALAMLPINHYLRGSALNFSIDFKGGTSIVTTFGKREDKQYVKNGSTPQLLNADGMSFNYDSLNHWAAGDYRFNSGKTTQKGAVVTQTSADAKVVAALQGHAGEVDELARDGMAAMMRGMRSRIMGVSR